MAITHNPYEDKSRKPRKPQEYGAGQPASTTLNINQQLRNDTQPSNYAGTNNQRGGAVNNPGAGAGGGYGGGYGGGGGTYDEQLDALYEKIVNGEDFEYDLNGDILYRQMADQYSQLGQLAMRDAMGTAAGLTGGYGNSYAQHAGQQAYQQHLTQLNANIPEFYDRAYQRWTDEQAALMDEYAFVQALQAQEDARRAEAYAAANGGNAQDTDGGEETGSRLTLPAEAYDFTQAALPGVTSGSLMLTGAGDTTGNPIRTLIPSVPNVSAPTLPTVNGYDYYEELRRQRLLNGM